MSYFGYLPQIEYNIRGNKYGETFTARDIFIRNLIKQNVVEKAIDFEKHTIGDGERPDTTSYLVYGSVKYDWIIFLANQMFNPYFHQYRQIIEEETDTTTLKEVIIDKDAYNALPSGEKKRITKYDMEFKRNERNK